MNGSNWTWDRITPYMELSYKERMTQTGRSLAIPLDFVRMVRRSIHGCFKRFVWLNYNDDFTTIVGFSY